MDDDDDDDYGKDEEKGYVNDNYHLGIGVLITLRSSKVRSAASLGIKIHISIANATDHNDDDGAADNLRIRIHISRELTPLPWSIPSKRTH